MTPQLQDPLDTGTAVSGAQAESLGTVVEVLTDPADGRATWAWVAVGHAHGIVRAVPLGGAARTDSGISVPFAKAFVAGAPDAVVPSGRGRLPAAVVLAEQDRLHAHYGLVAVGGPGGSGPAGELHRVPFGRGRRLVFHGMLAVGLARGVVEGVRSALRRGRT